MAFISYEMDAGHPTVNTYYTKGNIPLDLDQGVRQHVPVPANIQKLHTAIEEVWDNMLQATINSLINSM